MIYIEEIKKYLPQRYPFLMIDRVIEVEPGVSVTAIKNVSVNEPHFNGHFPAEAVMPGVLMIEAMAQAAGVLGLVSNDGHNPDEHRYLLCGVNNTRFRRKVVPGDQLTIKAKLITTKRNILKFQCEATVDGELACSTDLMVAAQKVDDDNK